MAFAEGFERGGRMAQGIIGTYRDANQRARERAAEEEIAALNAQYARSGEVIEAPPPRTGLRPDLVSGALPVNLNRMQPTPAAGLGPTPAPAQQPVQQMLRQVATPASGGLTARMNTEAAAVAERPVRATPTPPAQSQIYRDQADVYSRFGLTDDARRARDLGLQAERDEQRTATEQERYETTQQQYREGLRREDARSAEQRRQWWSGETRARNAAQREADAQQDTQGALALVRSNAPLSEIIAEYPGANISSVMQVYNANMDETQSTNLRTASAQLRQALTANPDAEITTNVSTIADLYGVDPAALYGNWAIENEAQVAQTQAKLARTLNQLGQVNTAEQFNSATAAFYDPNTEDEITPEWKKDEESGAWMLFYGDEVLSDAGVFFDTASVPGWRFAMDNLRGGLQQLSPYEGTAAMIDFQKAVSTGASTLTPAIVLDIAAEARAQSVNPVGEFDPAQYADKYQEILNTVLSGGDIPSEEPILSAGGDNVRALVQNPGGLNRQPVTQTGINTANGADTARQQIARAQSITAELEEADAAYARLNARNPSGGNPQVNAEKAAIESRIQQLSRERQEIMIDLGLPQNTAF
jgi:hypothetical protein